MSRGSYYIICIYHTDIMNKTELQINNSTKFAHARAEVDISNSEHDTRDKKIRSDIQIQTVNIWGYRQREKYDRIST